ncbi:VOC family protein [Cellulosimicrobium arenosum]|uniref:VOC family protein n=1 Tax=Cellulosimicrobium arenosum TaxID=2708133 RepID=A0A927J3E9_9MICO|nr:VOC family protein [Cellulosimicrobium arenosum]MBD8080755.1 VOC family protein [Cellulosimicrobium arenosum]
MRAIIPSLWFDGNLAEAIEFYTALFPGTRTGEMLRQPDGTAVAADFELAGQRFSAVNGGPQFPFTEAVSFVVECESQDEVDRYWSTLASDGGQESQCGWLKDRFGLSWQVVPVEFLDMIQDPDGEKVQRVVDVMMTQGKLELGPLRAAFEG